MVEELASDDIRYAQEHQRKNEERGDEIQARLDLAEPFVGFGEQRPRRAATGSAVHMESPEEVAGPLGPGIYVWNSTLLLRGLFRGFQNEIEERLGIELIQIGRAWCREEVCQYV